MLDVTEALPRDDGPRREGMREPDEAAAMLRLHALGWGSRRIAEELGCCRDTVRRYVRAGGWRGYRRPERHRRLDGLEGWLAERFRQHRGNADVLRQAPAREHGVRASLRTVERAVAHLRAELRAEARATVRFETPPGKQLQIDFGEMRLPIGGEPGRLFLFVATLGYSRRVFVRAFRHERQSAWLDGIEAAFRHFGGVPEELLLDNAKALVARHDPETREVLLNGRFRAFAAYWGVRPVACAPFRARAKGKDERGVGYAKRNAIAGHAFPSWAALEAHLGWWMREVADVRTHGTTGEAPVERFAREEAGKLRPLGGRPPFRQVRELARRVQADGCVDVDTNHYSVPWRLIGAPVTVVVSDGRVRVFHAGAEVACHAERGGRRERATEAGHLARPPGGRAAERAAAEPELLRPLAEYERLLGGGW